MIVDFRNITDAFTPNDKLMKIYGTNEFLLWERQSPAPGIKRMSDKFIFVDGLNLVSSETANIITGNIVVPRNKYNGNTSVASSIGTTWFTSQYDSYFNETVGGYNYGNMHWVPGFFQFIEHNEVEGIYLYSPEFDAVVADGAPFQAWEYTTDIQNGFNIAPYLSIDPFSDSGWTTTTLVYGNPGYSTFTQDYIYKEFNTVIWPTVIIHQDQLTVNDFFGYNELDKTNIQRRYMVKPALVPDRTTWQTVYGTLNGYSNFAGGATVSSTKYNAILPYNSYPGWN